MGAKYWIAFQLDSERRDGKAYNERWTALNDAVKANSSERWSEMTSFHIVESALTIKQLGMALKKTISLAHDRLLIRKLDHQAALYFGPKPDVALKQLMGYVEIEPPPIPTLLRRLR